MLEFTIHPTEAPWSTNQDRNLNYHQRAHLIKAWKVDTAAAWLALGYKKRHGYKINEDWYPPTIVQLEIGFTTNRKRDPHNYCGTVLKAVIDALVNAGLWPDDTPEWIGHREPVLVKDPLTKVTLHNMDKARYF